MHARRTLALGIAGTALLAAGCSGDAPEPTQGTARFTSLEAKESETAPNSTAPETTEPEGETAEAWKREYEWVLAHPSDYPVNSAASYEPTGFYSYALVEATGGGTPELLLQVDSKEFSPIIVFTIGVDGKAVASTDVLIAGAQSAGGSRARVDASASDMGLYQVESTSTGTTESATLFKLDGTNLTSASSRQQYSTSSMPADQRLIIFAPTQDRQPLELGELTVRPLPSNPGAANPTSTAAPAAGEVQLTGTVRAMTGRSCRRLPATACPTVRTRRASTTCCGSTPRGT